MWTDITDDRGRPARRCERHALTFGRTVRCPGCVADPGPPPDEEEDELPPPPEGCRSSLDHEAAFISEIAEVDQLIANVTPDDPSVHITDYHLVNSLAKLYDVRAKLRRAAAELARQREDDTLVELRDRRMRDGAKGRSH